MTVRIHADPRRHLAVAVDPDDVRLAWTKCGIRFAWGTLPPGQPARGGRCAGCFGG